MLATGTGYRMVVRRTLLVVVAIGCGDNAPARDLDTVVSGARLRVTHHVFDDGTRQVETEWLRDAARGEDCAPIVWSDGGRYCTPASQSAVFTEATCTDLVGRALPGTAPRYFHREFVLRGVGLPSRLYAAREPVTAPALVWALLDGQCVGPVDADPDATYHALGPALDASTFARVTRRARPLGPRLESAVYTSDDGLQLPLWRELHDTMLDLPCTPFAIDGATDAACAPEMPLATYFRDDACSAAALAIRSGAEQPVYVEYEDATACPAYAHVGEAIALPTAYRRTAAGCIATIPSSDERFFAIGEPLDLAVLSRTRTPARERLAHIELGAGDHTIDHVWLYDAQLDIECELVVTPEGERCLPRSSLAAEREPTFSDESCTAPLALVLVPSTTCRLPTHVVDRTTGVTVRALAPYAGAIYHLSTGDRCLPYALAGTARSYALGPEVPLSAFASATTVIDQ